MRLYLVRHAEAAPGSPDELRPLTEAGRRAARELGLCLAAPEPLDAVVCSPLLRARQTAAALAQASALAAPVVVPALAPGADTAAVLAAVGGKGARVAAVGHMPDVSEVAAALTGRAVAFAPGDVLEIELDLPESEAC